MNEPITPVHIKLWHRDFWSLLMALLLLTMSVYALIPVMPRWLMEVENFTPQETGLSMGVFALGLYLFGALCSWLVQLYRRNLVCMWAMLAVAVDIALLWYLDSLRTEFVDIGVILLQRLLLGAAFGLAQMVLSSTLIIDTCESAYRTEANHGAAWFSRMALSTGPLAGLVTYTFFGFDGVVWLSSGCALLAVVLVKMVKFPFRTPEDYLSITSLDRFFLPHGTIVYGHLVVLSLIVGLVLTLPLSELFYSLVMCGFVLALLAQQFVFPDADLKSIVLTGLLLLLASLLILLGYPSSPMSPVLMGLAVGLVGSRLLLFLIKLGHHCQRGTSVSTYFLGWETGLALGVALGYMVFYEASNALLYTSIVLTVVSLLTYHFFTHTWVLCNKNR
jgi:MFS family permease